jgi:hypothetical protein
MREHNLLPTDSHSAEITDPSPLGLLIEMDLPIFFFQAGLEVKSSQSLPLQ